MHRLDLGLAELLICGCRSCTIINGELGGVARFIRRSRWRGDDARARRPQSAPHYIAFFGRLFRAAYALPALVLNRVAKPECLCANDGRQGLDAWIWPNGLARALRNRR